MKGKVSTRDESEGDGRGRAAANKKVFHMNRGGGNQSDLDIWRFGSKQVGFVIGFIISEVK